ncbi:hypothetical protein KAK06_22470 [Ideonella sp. 4Y11]|uniref:Uncharacterized protein n=1 Tax=Ideonella aquatica TaxID=2824119 RepID=A0A940YLC7_9BURK|nr:hypothetical protein [Ideonella aquatica]MBQ0961719.1 hypothetical protein [Ideonella aquatica]
MLSTFLSQGARLVVPSLAGGPATALPTLLLSMVACLMLQRELDALDR